MMNNIPFELGESVQSEFYSFLTNHGKGDVDPSVQNLSKYQFESLDLLKAGSITRLFRIDFADLDDFNPDLAEAVAENFLRLESYLNNALRKMITEVSQQPADDFSVAFFNLNRMETLRGLRGDHIGQLISFAGRVTRTGEVRPELVLATFHCMTCGSMVTNVEQEFKLTLPPACSNRACRNQFINDPFLYQAFVTGKRSHWLRSIANLLIGKECAFKRTTMRCVMIE